MSPLAVDEAIAAAEVVLHAAGVPQPQADAQAIAAWVMQSGERAFDEQLFQRLVKRRAARLPLEQLLGTVVFGGCQIAVGPGVFIPQRQSEAMLAWCLSALREVSAPTVVDCCTGSGALAVAIARARPDAKLHGADISSAALAWAQRNADAHSATGGTPIQLHAGDVGDQQLLSGLDGTVDLVLCNPPYKPASVSLIPEFAMHQPTDSLYAGELGLDVIVKLVPTAERLLRPGGILAVEHDVRHAAAVPALLAMGFTDVADHPDADGMPRFATARRATRPPEPQQ